MRIPDGPGERIIISLLTFELTINNPDRNHRLESVSSPSQSIPENGYVSVLLVQASLAECCPAS
jgi:hypothetical protein